MTEEEFRFQDKTRKLEIMRNNYAVYHRRAYDQNYGTEKDRIDAAKEAIRISVEYHAATGRQIRGDEK